MRKGNSKAEALKTSITHKLRNLANFTGTTYENILNTFLLERMLIRLLRNKKLSKKLIFKGGFVGLRVYESTRYTVDLDALIRNAEINSVANLAIKSIAEKIDDGVWFIYEF